MKTGKIVFGFLLIFGLFGTDCKAAPADKSEGEIRFAVASLIQEVMDPTLSSVGAKFYLELVYDHLVGANLSNNTISKERGLARDWKISPDAKTYTFYLRSGVKFHDGWGEVTAEDVKYSIDRFRGPKAQTTYSGILRDYIERIETPDPLTVVIHLKSPYGFLHYFLSPLVGNEGMVMPRKYIEEKGASYFNSNPIGTGAYKFKEQEVGRHIVLEAAENHWRAGVPKFRRISFMLVPELSSRIARLRTGEADAAQITAERVKELPQFKVFSKDNGFTVGMRIHNQFDPKTYLSSPKVREALNLAINREEIRTFIFTGMGKLVGHHVYGSSALGYKPIPLYPYDPARARKLLTEAYPGGVSLSLYSFQRPEAAGLIPKVVEAVAAYWEKVGIRAKIIPVDFVEYRSLQRAKGSPKLVNAVAAMPVSNRVLMGSNISNQYHSQGDTSVVRDPVLDKLIDALEAEKSPERYGQVQQNISEYVRKNHMCVPLIEIGPVFAADPKKIATWDLGSEASTLNIESLYQRK